MVTEPPTTFEFGSPAWVAEAASYLPGAVAAIADTLDGVNFELCELYTDPPEHLAQEPGQMGWHIVIHGSQVTVADGIRTDLDQMIKVDYTTCIPYAKAIYPEVRGTPKDSVGPPRVPKELVRVLVDFHNHMASVTA